MTSVRTPWVPGELKRALALTARLNHDEVAETLNREFHHGKAVRHYKSVEQALYKARKSLRKQHGADTPVPMRTGGRPAKPAAPPTPAPTGASEQITIDGDQQHFVLRTKRLLTLEDALQLKAVDQTKWKVIRAKLNTWEMGAKGPDGKILVEPLHQVDFTIAPKSGIDHAAERAALLAEVKDAAPFAKARPFAKRSASGVALELDIFDLHLGKQGWLDECGENSDLASTEAIAEQAMWAILGRAAAFSPERVVLPYGNDATNIDNRRGQTTAGTQVDSDTRYWRIVRRSRALWSRLIRSLLAEVGPVTVPIVPGNHDEQTTIMIGELLAMEFADNPHVVIDNTLYPRKYWQHGCTLLGFTHGNEEKHADLPLLMASEQPEAWAQTQFREWHIGHFHHSKETRFTAGDSFKGVGVRIISSLSGADHWHVRKGYRALRMAEGFLWDAQDGYVGHVPFWYNEPLSIPRIVEAA